MSLSPFALQNTPASEYNELNFGDSGVNRRGPPPAHPKHTLTVVSVEAWTVFWKLEKRIFMPSRIYSIVAILCLLIAGAVWSQDTRGTITGRITDPSGAVIPGAQVVVTNPPWARNPISPPMPTAFTARPALSPGMYQIEVVARASRRPCATTSKCASPTAWTSISRLKSAPRSSQVTVDLGDAAAQCRIGLGRHRGGFQTRGGPAALLRQPVPADRPFRRRHLQRQRPPGPAVRADPHRQLLHGRHQRHPERRHHRRRAHHGHAPTPTR